MFNMGKKLLALCLATFLLAGCGGNSKDKTTSQEKIFNYGTVAYGPQHGDAGLNPHDGYSGWSTVRYGVGETLFKFNDAMEPTPWLAKSYEQIDHQTLKITLNDNITFSNGKKVDGQAVKDCLEHLIKVHDRAPGDLKIASIEVNGQEIIIKSRTPSPVLINYLSDPYAAIIDMQAGVTADKKVIGTGPFIAQKVTDNEVELVKNPKYWGGKVKVDKVRVRAINDGDTLTMALQSGELDATQGLPYSSLELFAKNNKFKVASEDTSRSFFCTMNYRTPALQDIRVRKAIAMAIDKDNFAKVLLKGNGTSAVGPFPASMPFGDSKVKALGFDLNGAKQLLTEAGWKDTDGDGYVDKDGKNLTVRWLTYPGRVELPLLAEAVQASLKQIGIKALVNSTANHKDFMKKGDWDVYASAMVTAPTGDPEYFFTTLALGNSALNRGKYVSPQMDALEQQLSGEFDKNKRNDLAIKMEQQMLDDVAFIFASHLKMSFVMKNTVTGFKPHPSDYYEITADLDIQ
jgi:peptide/nickel transport system substrate-binding protein